jgi:hypothetical protein
MIPEDIDWSRLTVGFFLGYAISWVYFFLSLPILMKLLGKVNGTIINYGLSWLVWILVTYTTHSTAPDDDEQKYN